MERLKNWMFYLWLGVWAIGGVIVLLEGILLCAKLYPVLISLSIERVLATSLLGLILIALIPLLGKLLLELILSIKNGE